MQKDSTGALLIETPAEKAIREQGEETRRQNRYRKVQIWFNGILTFTSILTIAILLYQNQIMSATLELDQRAWLGVTRNRVAINPASFQFHLDYRNVGKTPALQVRHAEQVVFLNEKSTGAIERAHRKHYASLAFVDYGAVAPAGDGVTFVSVDLGERAFKEIELGKATILVLGEIRYETFQKPRSTQFCFVLISIGSNTMANCSDGLGNHMN